VGGAMGASKSVISLIAGVACGGLALAGAFVVGGNSKAGIGIALVGAVLAVGGMLPRFLKSHAVWPAGVVAFASIAVALFLVVALVSAGKGSR
ncbi:MAG: TMEM14 family protein, partial [Armatimonadota bacterium]